MLKRISSKSKKECFICYDENDSPLELIETFISNKKCKCNEYIHKSCLKKCLDKKKTCPLCNTPIDIKSKNNFLLHGRMIRYTDDTVVFRGSIYTMYAYNDHFFSFYCYNMVITICSITVAISLIGLPMLFLYAIP